MTVIGLDDKKNQFKLTEEDSGIGWAVTFILLAIVVGFGLIMFLDRQPAVEYNIDKAFNEMRDDCPLLRNHSDKLRRQSTISDALVADLDELVDLNRRSDYPIRAASSKRFNRVQ